MASRWMLAFCLRSLVCLAGFWVSCQCVEAAGPRGGFFGGLLGREDEETPTPPVPRLGVAVEPVRSLRPLPRVLPGPSIPPLEDVETATSGQDTSIEATANLRVEAAARVNGMPKGDDTTRLHEAIVAT